MCAHLAWCFYSSRRVLSPDLSSAGHSRAVDSRVRTLEEHTENTEKMFAARLYVMCVLRRYRPFREPELPVLGFLVLGSKLVFGNSSFRNSLSTSFLRQVLSRATIFTAVAKETALNPRKSRNHLATAAIRLTLLRLADQIRAADTHIRMHECSNAWAYVHMYTLLCLLSVSISIFDRYRYRKLSIQNPSDPAGILSEGSGVTKLLIEGSRTIPRTGI